MALSFRFLGLVSHRLAFTPQASGQHEPVNFPHISAKNRTLQQTVKLAPESVTSSRVMVRRRPNEFP